MTWLVGKAGQNWLAGLRDAHLANLHCALTTFGQWWLHEFLSFFPPARAEWLVGSGVTRLTLVPTETGVEMHLATENRTEIAREIVGWPDYSNGSTDDFLHRNGLRSDDVTLFLTLPRDRCFERTFILPAQVARAIDEVVTSDLLQKMPFTLSDIYHGYSVEKWNGKLEVRTYLAKRDSVHSACVRLHIEAGA